MSVRGSLYVVAMVIYKQKSEKKLLKNRKKNKKIHN